MEGLPNKDFDLGGNENFPLGNNAYYARGTVVDSRAYNEYKRGAEGSVEIVICDDTGGISFLLWDNHVILLCGKSAEQIKMEAGLCDEEYPETLDGMMEKVLLFRIYVRSGHLKETNNLYSVAVVCDDTQTCVDGSSKGFALDGFDTRLQNGAIVYRRISLAMRWRWKILRMCDKQFKTIGKRSSSSIKNYDGPLQQSRYEDGQLSTNRFSRKCLKRSKMHENDKH
ncbi:hypothetical protein PIB30_060917 [Stylosanthes scabra]|uniref:Uncharacterized protein n=1 Tax=Stylosanthes scabra TaxID=79078 RepID=A0ABU6QK54_9FABA|nr:hypothetical protein [Stylosanthes scabra]